MANITTPISAAATNTQVEDTAQNPVTTTNTVNHGGIFHLTLRFGPGINIDPNQIYDMVDGTFGTVASDKEIVARNTMILRIDS